MTDAALDYRDRAARLDTHLRTCASCSAGVACPTGDDTAEAEFRAWRAWEADDAQATREHRRRGFPW